MAEAPVTTLTFLDDPPPLELVEAALRLTEHSDIKVRDHACFVLAQQWQDIDTRPSARLWLPSSTISIETHACEALVGLAFRHDESLLFDD